MSEENVTEVNLATIDKASKLPEEKQIYFNGFTVGISPQDVAIVLSRNSNPIAFLNTSHFMAKELQRHLTLLLADLEKSQEKTTDAKPE